MHQILIVDDHSVVRTGLGVMITNQLQTKADVAPDGKTAIKKIKEKNYDLVILDINIPDTDCGNLLSTVLSLRPDIKVLIFSMNNESLFALHYLKMGAMGFLSKNALDEEIINALQQVLKGKKYMSPELIDLLGDNISGIKNVNPFHSLSERELRVTHHLLNGNNILEISQIMNLHTSTVGTYRTRIFEKLGIKNLVDLTELARVYHFL
jgi:two-component system invasion response regulator UvrY